jgi:carboxylesterase
MKYPLTIASAEPFFLPGGNTGCLLIHGFTGTPKEMRWFAEYLNQKGHTVLGIRLPAHATQPEAMLRVRWWDWVASVEDGLNILSGCTKDQFVMGLSMGGILSLLAAAHFKVKGAVAVSTPYSLPADPRLKFIKLLHWVVPRVSKGKSDFRNKAAEKIHVDYPYYPTRSIIQLMGLIREMQASIPRIKVPVLLAQSHGDKGIPAESMDTIYRNLKTRDKTKLWVEDSGHVVIREPDREIVFKATADFIKRLSK